MILDNIFQQHRLVADSGHLLELGLDLVLTGAPDFMMVIFQINTDPF